MVFLYTLMASDTNEICQLCGSRIKGNEGKHVYTSKDSHCFLRFHKNCFKCSVCCTPLTAQNYFTSPKKRIYCTKHYDYDGRNKHDNFFRELSKFKQHSIEKTEVLINGKFSPKRTVLHPGEPNEQNSDGKSGNWNESCPNMNCYNTDSNQLAEQIQCQCFGEKTGYWNECCNENCPQSNCFSRCCDEKHFEIPMWNEEYAFGDVEKCEEEIYEACFHNQRHTNFYSVDERIGPIVLSLKHEKIEKTSHYRILLRSSSHIIEGLVPLSSFCSIDYDDTVVLDVIAKELDISTTFRPFNDAIPPCKLLLLDKVMLKSEFKIGVLFINTGQLKEEQFFTNTDHSIEFEDFLSVIGDKVKLTGFTGYNGGLDTQNGLTGDYSIYKEWNKYKLMYHVSTMLPMEEHDDQKLQRKRHIGNDIVCLVFLAPGSSFDPRSIKSNFLHVFIIVEPVLVNGTFYYKVDVASRDFVHRYGPPLVPSKLFKKDESFQNWLYSKIINGERASYRSPKFAQMQERTRRQLLEEIVHDQACKEVQPLRFGRNPFQRFLPLRNSFTRVISNNLTPSLQRATSFSVDQDINKTIELRRDLKRTLVNGISQYHDVLFLVGKESGSSVPAVKALLAVKSRVFNELFFPGTPQESRRRSSVLSRVSPQYLQQHFKPCKRFPTILKKYHSFEKDGKNNNPSPLSSVADLSEGHVPPSELHITEFSMEEFSALIEYVQTGSCVICSQIVSGLACAAEYYAIDDLKEQCIECCQELLNPYTACMMLTSVRSFDLRYDVAGRMEEIILSYIEENSERVFSCSNLSSLCEDSFSLILSSNLQVKEVRKFEAIKCWLRRIALYGPLNEELKNSLLSNLNVTKLPEECLTELSTL